MAKTDEITVQGYEAPDQVDINIKEEVPSPPGGAARWAETTEDKPQWGKASWWGNVGERARAVLPYLKDKARSYGALATDVWAKDILPNAVGKVYGGLKGVDSEDDYEDYDVDESRMPPLGPHYRPQSLDDYIVRRRDMKPSTEDVMSGRASVGGQMDYLDPSREYPGMLEAGALADVDASEAEVGRGGRFLGNLVNRLQGDFETSDKEDENAYRKALAAGQGALGYLSDTLPDQLEALAGEGGARLGMAALGPAFIKAKEKLNARDEMIKKLYADSDTGAFLPNEVPRNDYGEYDIPEIRGRLKSYRKYKWNRDDLPTIQAFEKANDAYYNEMRSLLDELDETRGGRELWEGSKNRLSRWIRGRKPSDVLPTEQATQFYRQLGKDQAAANEAYRNVQHNPYWDMFTPEAKREMLNRASAAQGKITARGISDRLDDVLEDISLRRTLSPEDRVATLKSVTRNAEKGMQIGDIKNQLLEDLLESVKVELGRAPTATEWENYRKYIDTMSDQGARAFYRETRLQPTTNLLEWFE